MIHCPHCSRSIESHDGKPCPRKFSRRFFFGLMAGAGAAVVLPVTLPEWQAAEIRRLHYICLENLSVAKALGFCDDRNQNLIRQALGQSPWPGWPAISGPWKIPQETLAMPRYTYGRLLAEGLEKP